MGVYSRFKKDPDGLRKLVELLESTPTSRRQKMIDVGMVEDSEYTEKALKYMLTFQDILSMPDSDLMEVLDASPPKMIAFSVSKMDAQVHERFIKCSPPLKMAEVRDCLDMEIGLREVGGAQLKLVTIARDQEKKGRISTKRIPLHAL